MDDPDTNLADPDRDRVVVTLTIASSIANAVAITLAASLGSELKFLPPPVVVVDSTVRSSGDHRIGQLIVDHLRSMIDDVQLLVPTAPVMSFLQRGPRGLPIDVSARAEHIPTVWLPRAIAMAGTLIAANDLRGVSASRPTLALGIWSRFAGWRERIGARVATRQQGLEAEIALAVQPTLSILADAWQDRPVIVAASDQIAAELVGLALRQFSRGGDVDPLGPWQDPVVQRATELDFGVRVPGQIAIRGIWASAPAEAIAANFSTLVTDIATRLGVVDAIVSDAGSDSTQLRRPGNPENGLL